MTTIINGSTGVSAIQAGSITQSDLAANVATTGPAFSAYQTAVQAFAATTFTKVNLFAKEFDTANSFDNVTNSRFQPNVPGYYMLVGSVGFNAYCAAISCIYKNGQVYKYGSYGSSSADSNVSCLVYLNGSSDYVELWGYTSIAQNTTNTVNPYTYFQGFLARSV